MWWFLLWTVLVLLSLTLLGWLGLRVFRKGTALVRELGDSSARVAEVTEQARRGFDERLRAQTEDGAEPNSAGTDDDRAPLTRSAGLR